jgi:hypothetical protein
VDDGAPAQIKEVFAESTIACASSLPSPDMYEGVLGLPLALAVWPVEASVCWRWRKKHPTARAIGEPGVILRGIMEQYIPLCTPARARALSF